MKKHKISVIICAAVVSMTFATANVSAVVTPRPMQGAEVAATTEITTENTNSNESEEVSSNTQSMVQTSVNATTNNKKSFTHWNAFLWFLLSVAVNFVVSCWVGNRFYRLARKNTQTSNEIRALRKDIEEKFASTLTEIEDPAVEIMNRNENYSRAEDGLSMPEHRTRIEMNEEEREMMRKWDKKRITERVVSKEETEPEEEDAMYETRPVKRAYQPTRRSSGIEFEDEEYDDEVYEEETNERPAGHREAPKSSIENAKNKAKDFLSNVFPFED